MEALTPLFHATCSFVFGSKIDGPDIAVDDQMAIFHQSYAEICWKYRTRLIKKFIQWDEKWQDCKIVDDETS